MATLYAALCIIQTFFGLGSRKDESRNTTDWLKLALAVAAQPEDEESKRVVQAAIESNNQEFLALLRAALDTRVAAAARLADIESDGIECRAFLPGSPALWGWTTNTVAEYSILKAGVESAMSGSVFDSPSASCSGTSKDVFVGLNSSETMGGATLRDIYAKAWEFHREPLVWTPRGPGAGVGASTWTLTPASLTSQGARNRNRSVSDASESRLSIASQSPCLHAQRNRIRRDSLHDVFTAIDATKGSKASPCTEPGIVTPSLSPVTPPSPLVLSETPAPRRPRRSTSCARSHISSTTAVTVSECSTTQELHGLGLGRSLDRSVWSRPDTPSDSWFGDCEPRREVTSKGKGVALPQAARGRGLAPSAAAFRRNKALNNSNIIHKPNQTKQPRPGVMPLQSTQASAPKRTNESQHLASATSSKNQTNVVTGISRVNNGITGTPITPVVRSREPSSLRRVRSVATMTPSPSPSGPRTTNSKAPIIGPVPAAMCVPTKQTPAEPPRVAQDGVKERQESRVRLVSTPTAPGQSATRYRTPSMTQSRIPRPASRAGSIAGSIRVPSPSVSTTSRTTNREPRQLPTPASTTRVRERASSQASRPAPTDSIGRARSRAGSSPQDRAAFTKDVRLSRPSSRAHLIAGANDVAQHRSRRPNSIAGASTLLDRRETVTTACDTRVAA
ncbi:hypothetical protein FRC09_003469 [Ceratobasidium sp. 395]|nr:hypothetical protein FRC09_003469 [Ceratobasidium sp. 395]